MMGLRNWLSRGSNDDDTDWPYRYEERKVKSIQGASVIAEGIDTDPKVADDPQEQNVTFAAPLARRMLMSARNNPKEPLWVGIGTRRGKEAAVEKTVLFKHLACFGTTGTGKSNLQKNCFRQVIEPGAGGCFIDPGGDDSRELLEIIPKHRLNDVIWVEPGSTTGRVSGFNFLKVDADPGSQFFDTAVENIVADFRHMLGADQWWGPRMDGVTASLVRASARTDYEFTAADLFYIIKSEQNSRQFAQIVRDADLDLLADSVDEIAELDKSEREPLWRRFKEWVESPVARQVMSLRGSPINIEQAVTENKIIIVRMGSEDRDIKRLIGTALFRRIWSAIRSRAEMESTDRTPFYLFADEFDNLASQDGAIDQMLSESRKYRLSMFLCCQYPNQIPDVLPALEANCDTWLSFSPGSPQDSRRVADNIGVNWETLRDEAPYYLWMTVTLEATGQRSEPFRVYTLPPYPPLRTRAQRNALIQQYLERDGLPRQTSEEFRQSILVRGGEGALERGEHALDALTSPGNGGSTTTGAGASAATQRLYEAAHTVQIRRDAVGEAVPYEQVVAELRRIVGDDLGSDSKMANLIEETPDTELRKAKQDGERVVTLTTEGLRNAGLTQDTGSAENGGGFDHRLVLAKAKAAFVKLGYAAWLPTQDSNEAADGMADLPIDPMATNDPTERREREVELQDEYPHVWEFAGEYNVSIEAETSTMDAPEQTLTNLRKAVNAGRFCVFALKDETFNDDNHNQFDHWRERGEKIIYDTYREDSEVKIDYDTLTFASETDENGNRLFYNQKKRRLKIEDGIYALRPVREEGSTQIRWEEEYGEVILRDTGVKEDGTEIAPPKEYARFDTPEAVANVEREDMSAYYEYDQGEGVYVVRTKEGDRMEYETKAAMKKNWRRIYAPFIPENEYRRTPTEDDFCFVVFPDADNPDYDEPQLASRGAFEPLLPEEITMPETPEALAEEGNEPENDENADESDADPETADASKGKDENTEPEKRAFIEAVAGHIAAQGVSEAQAVERTKQVLSGVDATDLTEERAVSMVAAFFDIKLTPEHHPDHQHPQPAETTTEQADAPRSEPSARTEEAAIIAGALASQEQNPESARERPPASEGSTQPAPTPGETTAQEPSQPEGEQTTSESEAEAESENQKEKAPENKSESETTNQQASFLDY